MRAVKTYVVSADAESELSRIGCGIGDQGILRVEHSAPNCATHIPANIVVTSIEIIAESARYGGRRCGYKTEGGDEEAVCRNARPLNWDNLFLH
jgi:hypothetical protein